MQHGPGRARRAPVCAVESSTHSAADHNCTPSSHSTVDATDPSKRRHIRAAAATLSLRTARGCTLTKVTPRCNQTTIDLPGHREDAGATGEHQGQRKQILMALPGSSLALTPAVCPETSGGLEVLGGHGHTHTSLQGQEVLASATAPLWLIIRNPTAHRELDSLAYWILRNAEHQSLTHSQTH